MRETLIIRTFENSGTKYVVFSGENSDYESDYFVKASGRLNFIRPIQICDPYHLKSRSYFRYPLGGPFTLVEEGVEYSFDPTQDGWSVKYPGGSFEFKGDQEVLQVILNVINIKEVMQTQKAAELTTEESKKALAVLSEMLKENIFPLEKFEKIRKYAEECKDERVKDMVRIVQKHFHKTQEENSDVVIRIVE